MKRIALALAAWLPALSFAQTPDTLSFSGQVHAQTCRVAVNGNAANRVIVLPTVVAGAIQAAGSTAGETPFTLEVTHCAPFPSNLAIRSAIASTEVTRAGNLINAGSASNVQVQLLTAPGGSPIPLNGFTSVAGLNLETGTTHARHELAVRYISEEGAAAAGSVSAAAQYTLDYL